MYVDSEAEPHEQLLAGISTFFPVTGFSPANPPNTPTAEVVLSRAAEETDAHGATLTKHERKLWMADRGRNLIWVFDTDSDTRSTGLFRWQRSDDQLPICRDIAGWQSVFMSLRGPNPLTADPHVSTGNTPGRRGDQGHRGWPEWQVLRHRTGEQYRRDGYRTRRHSCADGQSGAEKATQGPLSGAGRPHARRPTRARSCTASRPRSVDPSALWIPL